MYLVCLSVCLFVRDWKLEQEKMSGCYDKSKQASKHTSMHASGLNGDIFRNVFS